MTVILVMPIAEGLLIAADGAGATDFEGSFFRMEKIRPHASREMTFVLGMAQLRHPESKELLFDFLNYFLTDLPFHTNREHLMLELQQVGPICCDALGQIRMPPVYGNEIVTIGMVRHNEDLVLLTFDYYPTPGTVRVRIYDQTITPTVIQGPADVRSIISNADDPNFDRCRELIGVDYVDYLIEPGLPRNERNLETAVAAVRGFIRATKVICHDERRITPIGPTFDAYLLTEAGTARVANDAALFD